MDAKERDTFSGLYNEGITTVMQNKITIKCLINIS